MRKTPSTKDFGSCAPVRNMCAPARALAGAHIPAAEVTTEVRITNWFIWFILMYEKEIKSSDCM